jgi:hypothetical protein
MKVIKLKESELVDLVKSVIAENELTNEQLLKGLGDKIKSGVNKVAQKVADITKPKTIQEPATQKGRDLDQLRSEWIKVNADTTNMKGFGEFISPDMSMARSGAGLKARAAILKKMNKQSASFGAEIVDEATFQLENGSYHNLVIMQPTNY